MTLKTGISGIRGIVGDSLTDEVISDFAKAFATYIKKGRIVIGRDTRASGKKLEKLVVTALKALGISVINAGICPTPTVLLLVKEFKADGGIVITASHNPPQWNGFKFISRKGIFLDGKQNKELLKKYASKKFKGSRGKGGSKVLKQPYKDHINTIFKNIDTKGIRKEKFKVVLDSCNGAGSIITVKLLKQLGCKVVPLYTDTKKGFPRGAEPTPKNLKALCRKVKKEKADIGFAQDPDADRLSIVTDKGIAVGEEYTLALSAMYVLSLKRGKRAVATNLSTSMMIDDVAKRYNAKVIRSKVGEINVTKKLLKAGAVIGGEGNGGVIYPKTVCSRDSLTGIALILALMAGRDKKISALVKEIPKYHMIKSKVRCSSPREVEFLLKKTKHLYKKGRINTLDGIKISIKDLWIHVRPSNTEPVARVIAEGKNKKEVQKAVRSLIK
ncbi:phosphoglucosamine mutase [Candidatus Margulisiibacteriota bacterium]